MTAFAVSVRGVSHAYGARQALQDVSFDILPGELFGLLGPNGSGKSTLFRLLATLLPISAGEIAVVGHDVGASAAAVRRVLGVTFQSPSLDRKLTVVENLRCQGYLYGLTGASLSSRIDRWLSHFDLQARRRDLVETLSGGYQRRVEIAKSLLHEPRVLLLDEPSSGLDPNARADLWRLLAGLRQSAGLTVIATTHLLDEAEAADRIAILDQGRLAALGTPQDLRSSIGGDCVTLAARDVEKLAALLQSQFGLSPLRLGANLRIDITDAGSWIPRLWEACGAEIVQLSLGKPTLEDVFAKRTGRNWRDVDAPTPADKPRKH